MPDERLGHWHERVDLFGRRRALQRLAGGRLVERVGVRVLARVIAAKRGLIDRL